MNPEYSNTSCIIAQNALNEYELLLGVYLNVLRREFPIDSSIKKTSAIYRDEPGDIRVYTKRVVLKKFSIYIPRGIEKALTIYKS